MCQPLDDEALGLMALGYRPVLYVGVHCTCGDWRLGIHPDNPPFCPNCDSEKWTAHKLGDGFTRRAVPFFQKEDSFVMDPIERDWAKHRNVQK